MEAMPFSESTGCLRKAAEGRQAVQAQTQRGSRYCSCLGHFLVTDFFSSIGQGCEGQNGEEV